MLRSISAPRFDVKPGRQEKLDQFFRRYASVSLGEDPAKLAAFYGEQPPWSFQVFLRVRPPARHRMLDMIMTRPMGH